MANQEILDWKMIIEARWPNISNSDDLFNRKYFTAGATGIRLMGANSIIQINKVAFNFGMGIMLGENCTANNNWFKTLTMRLVLQGDCPCKWS